MVVVPLSIMYHFKRWYTRLSSERKKICLRLFTFSIYWLMFDLCFANSLNSREKSQVSMQSTCPCPFWGWGADTGPPPLLPVFPARRCVPLAARSRTRIRTLLIFPALPLVCRTMFRRKTLLRPMGCIWWSCVFTSLSLQQFPSLYLIFMTLNLREWMLVMSSVLQCGFF